jgi:hypothetical protein
MGQAEIVVVGLLVAVAGLSAIARRLSLPYPIVLVLGGALLGFVPGLPEVRLDPELVLLVFLPPCTASSDLDGSMPVDTVWTGSRQRHSPTSLAPRWRRSSGCSTSASSSAIQLLRPGVDEVVALDGRAFKVEDDDRTALTGFRYLAEP